MGANQVTPVEQLDYAIWPILHRMTTRGMLVDQTALDALERRVVARMEEVLAELETLVGHPVNPNSGNQIADWMLEEGFTGRMTKGGDRLATDERSLKLHVSPVIDLTLEYRGLQKIKSTYIEPIRGYCAWDGRVHPRWKPTRVPSGRLACGRERPVKPLSQWDSPNLMAFPNKDEWGKGLLACFIADPGYVMFSIDYSQIEMRNAAALSQDEGLLRIYREERDIYTETACALFGVAAESTPEWKRAYRLPAKIVTLGVMYGIGDQKLFEEMLRWGCGTPAEPRFSVEECGALRARWFGTYTGVRALVARVCAGARAAGGWAVTELGRRRFLPALLYEGRRYPQSKMRLEAERMAFNHLIQGTSQEDMKRGMIAAMEWADSWEGEGAFEPLLQIHDELIGQTRDPGMVEGIADAMVAERGGVMLKTEWSTGQTWAELK